MTEPFVNEDGELIEREQDSTERAIRQIRTVGAKLTHAMDVLNDAADALKQHGNKDLNSLLASLKVSAINGQLIVVAREWLKNKGVS